MRTVHTLDLEKCFRRGEDYMKLSDIGNRLGLRVIGNGDREIRGVSSPDYPLENGICAVWDKRTLTLLPENTAVMTREKYLSEAGERDAVLCETPRARLAELLSLFALPSTKTGIDPKAEVSLTARVSPNAYVAPFAYVGDNCEIGEGTIIEPHAVLLRNVKTGRNCLIHSGAVIGADGFGFERTEAGIVKIPQNGGVMLGDDVEIGACTTIDRGTLSDTVIGSGTKIDNQVQIGHNVKIGKDCIICSMSGIAGSTELGDNVTISVQAGITDHVKIGSNVTIAGRSGVTSDVPSNAIISGFPARNHNDAKRALVLASDLPLLVKRLRNVEKRLDRIEL